MFKVNYLNDQIPGFWVVPLLIFSDKSFSHNFTTLFTRLRFVPVEFSTDKRLKPFTPYDSCQ